VKPTESLPIGTDGKPIREDPEKTVKFVPKSFDEIPLVKDEDERHEVLKSMFTSLREKFLKFTKPFNPKGEEGILIVCTLAHQILNIASPMMKPIIETNEGQEMLKTLLNAPTPSHVNVAYKKEQEQ